jgi:hypothetical protein
MAKKLKQVPKNAFAFLSDVTPECSFEEGSEDISGFKMVGYSGKEIKDHWYWGNLAFDLNGFKFNKDKFPVLWSHDSFDMDNILGFSTGPSITDEGLVFTEQDTTFVDNERTKQFREYSKKGVPFQASIRGNPTKIEYVPEGESVEVNGFQLNGPGHVWRETELVECSVCMFGADSHTSSKMFTEAGEEMVNLSESVFVSNPNENENQNQNKTEINMDYLVFRKEHPEEAKKFADLVLEDANKKFESEKKELIEANDEKEKAFNEKIEALENQVKEFEKAAVIAEEAARKEFAEKTWNEKLKDASIPERLHEKVKAFVSAEKFVGEDGFDKEAFEAAVVKEIKFWAETKEEEKIQGSGSFSKKSAGENEFSEKEAEEAADALLSFVR